MALERDKRMADYKGTKTNMKKALQAASDTLPETIAWFAVLLAISAGLYAFFEKETVGNALWWASVTASSTGYGDFYPKTLGGRLVGVGLMFTSLFVVLPVMIARVLDALNPNRHAFTDEEQRQLLADVSWIKERLQ